MPDDTTAQRFEQPARPPFAALLALALALPAPARAQGDTLSLSCVVCHGSADAPSRVPALHGLGAEQIDYLLREFRSGARAGTAMPRIALSLSDAEITALAAQFGRTTP